MTQRSQPAGRADDIRIRPSDPVMRIVGRTPVYVPLDAALSDVALVLAEESIGAALVRGPHGPVGIISERDVVQAIAEGLDPKQERVRALMTPDLAVIDSTVSILTAADVMLANEIRHLAVTTRETTIGLVSMRDVLAVLADEVWPTIGEHHPRRPGVRLYQELAHPGG